MATEEQKEVGCSLVRVGTLPLENTDLTPWYTCLVVSGDMIIVIDCNAWHVRLHRLRDGKLLAVTKKLESEPRGVHLINDSEICVIMLDGQIEIMSVQCRGDTGTITRGRTLQVEGGFVDCHRAMKFMDKVVVCGRKQDNIIYCCTVSVNDGRVETCYQICKGDFRSRSYLATKDSMIYISCYAGDNFPGNTGVYAYDIKNPSKQKYVYTHEDLKLPRGITVDKVGFIFVCNGCPDYIYHLTDRCQLVTIYKEKIPASPRGIFFDQQHGDLYLTGWMSQVITRYKCVYSDHQAPEVPVKHERRQPVIEETSTWTGHRIIFSVPTTVVDLESMSDSPQVTPSTPPTTLLPQNVYTDTVFLDSELSVDKGQSRVETDVPPPVQVPKDTEDDKQDLQDEDELLEAIKNNDRKVEEMIGNQKIPKRSIIEMAMKQDGYSKGVQLALTEMSKLLTREVSEAVGVWCGYRPEHPHTPVFVVTLKDQKCAMKKEDIPEPFIDYEILIRHKYVPNDEERCIVDRYGTESVRSEDVAHVNNCIATHTKSLMREHSNLSIIRPCPVKARGYMRKKMKVKKDTCIVFYVPVKGIIPVGEDKFPRYIDGIVTDVREGEFVFFGGHNAMEHHPKLLTGCCIARDKIGSLGGFVDLSFEKVGCLTAAHVVLTNDEIQQYLNTGDEEKRKLTDDLAQGEKQIEIHQPIPKPGSKPFGRVQAIALDAGNDTTPSVDAALIQITDDERKPVMGSFPDGDFENVGFTKEDPMLYTSGDILHDIEPHHRGSLVIKFGCTTGITRGCLEWMGVSVRPVNMWGNFCFPAMLGQLEINVQNFAASGDSGALVFLCVGGNVRNLQAIGMIVGGSSTRCSCFITPIKTVFEKLGLTMNRFKVFPPRQLSQPDTTSEELDQRPDVILARHLSRQETTSQALTECIKDHEHVLSHHRSILDGLSEKVNSIEINITQCFGRVEQDMNEQGERLMRVEQNMKENMNEQSERLMRVEQNMKENMNEQGERLIRVEQNLNESKNELTRIEQNMNENINHGFNRMEELFQRLSSKS